MSRTDDEILARMKSLDGGFDDFFGTQRADLAAVLPFEAAKPFLREGVTSDKWEPSERDAETVKACMFEYMAFAWEKANGCRGLSAGRSLDHMKAWLWLLGEDAAVEQLGDYDRYGKPQLRAICEAFGWDWRQWDNGEWVNDEGGRNLGVPVKVEPLRLGAHATSEEDPDASE